MVIGGALALFFLLAVLAMPAGATRTGQKAVYLATAAVSFVLMANAGAFLFFSDDAPQEITLPVGVPWIGAHFRFDSLSAFFMAAINLPAALAALYAVGYAEHLEQPRRALSFFPLFLLGMNGVLVADDAFSFLLFWEFMSLSSWFLVLANHRDPECRRAASVYLTMALMGTFCLLPAFALMAGAAGAYDFASMRQAALPPVSAALAIGLTLAGAGSKAGIMPLHGWLPLAHPAAPSHVSALMSGVMTKVAIYALIRVLFDIIGDIGGEWGVVMMALGAATAALGVLYALMQNDLKRLLAYSTVENIGFILIALGLATAFRAWQADGLAALALLAALYHVVNHSLFKTLLFLGAGAVQTATGEKNLDRLGGLLRLMPWTGWCFLVGAAAISAMPPFNGFVSEWLIYQSLFRGPSVPHWAMRFGVPAVGMVMALSAAFSAACFVRAFGVAFLGRPRSEQAANAREVAPSMRFSMLVIALLCLLLGVFPVTVAAGVALAVEHLTGVALETSVLGWPWLNPISQTAGSYSGTLVLAGGVALLLVVMLTIRLFGPGKIRRAPTWDCGHKEDIVNAQYSAQSFSQPLRRVFGTPLFRARENLDAPDPGDTRPAHFSVSMIDPVWDILYMGVIRGAQAISARLNRLQFLSIRQYLLLTFMTLVILLVVVAVRQS